MISPVTRESERRGLRVLRHRRKTNPRRATASPNQTPGHPTGMDRCLDLPVTKRPHSGDGSRRAPAKAIPLSRALARSARRKQIRAPCRLCDALPKIRRRVNQDLKLPGLPREKVLATVVRLLERTFIRVGNEEYARENKSFGLTTMKNRHVTVKGAHLRFQFRGKSGRQHEVDVTDPRIAKIVAKCQDLPGQDLFQYVDDEARSET